MLQRYLLDENIIEKIRTLDWTLWHLLVYELPGKVPCMTQTHLAQNLWILFHSAASKADHSPPRNAAKKLIEQISGTVIFYYRDFFQASISQ